MAIYRSTAVISHPALGGNGTNTWHARIVPNVLDLQVALQDATDALHTFYDATNDVTAGGTAVNHDGQWVTVDDPEGEVEDVDGFTSTNGTSAAVLPPSQCLVVGWGTAQVGRHARGRTFVGPLATSTLQDNGTPTETSRASLLAGAQALIDASQLANDWAIGVWSAGVTREPPQPPVFHDATRAAVANRFSVLRSRRD